MEPTSKVPFCARCRKPVDEFTSQALLGGSLRATIACHGWIAAVAASPEELFHDQWALLKKANAAFGKPVYDYEELLMYSIGESE